MSLHMNRRHFLHVSAFAGATAALRLPVAPGAEEPRAGGASWHDTPIAELQTALNSGSTTVSSLVEHFLRRIAEIDHAGPTLRSVIETNPDAVQIARDLDDPRKRRATRGPLYGIPVLVKDNLDT